MIGQGGSRRGSGTFPDAGPPSALDASARWSRIVLVEYRTCRSYTRPCPAAMERRIVTAERARPGQGPLYRQVKQRVVRNSNDETEHKGELTPSEPRTDAARGGGP